MMKAQSPDELLRRFNVNKGHSTRFASRLVRQKAHFDFSSPIIRKMVHDVFSSGTKKSSITHGGLVHILTRQMQD